MSLANRYRSGRVPHQHIGISSFTEDKLVLDAIGHARISGTLTVGVGTNNSGNGNISIGGTTGDVGQYLRSTGVGVEWADFADVRDTQVSIATAGQTVFTFTGNELNQYNPSFIDVYVNGVKLTLSEYIASNGSTVTLNSACFAGDIVELISYNTNQITNGMGGSTIGINTIATSTFNNINASGVVTATAYYGDGSNLTNVAASSNAAYATVAGISTVAENLTGVPDIVVRNINAGIATLTGDLSGTNASFSGNVSIGGTLTYEDVKNVDSVGLITARNGADISGVIKGFDYTQAPHSDDVVTIIVKVVTKTNKHRYFNEGSSSGYTFDGVESPFLTLIPGRTYKFDQSENSNLNHQLRFYLDSNRVTEYNPSGTGQVSFNGSAGSPSSYTQIEVFDTTPTILHYQCVNHPKMGNAIQFNSGTASGLSAEASVNTSGIITASRYYGDGTFLSGVQSKLVIQEEGSPVGTAGTINFVGTGVTASVSSDIATIQVSNHFAYTAGVATVAQGISGTPNITVAGLTGAGAQISGLCTASTFVGNLVGSIQGGNWAGYDSTATNNVSAGQSITAGNGFYGDGSNLSNIVSTSDNAPSNPSDGQMWWKSDEGVLKIYYQDIDSSQWVDASPGGGGSGDSAGSSDLLNDDTPKLGGNLDLNNRNIRGTGNITIAGIGSFTNSLQVNGTSNLSNVDVTGIATFNSDVKFKDSNKLEFGTDSDLIIYHDSVDSYIKQQASGTGDLIINSDNLYLRTSNNGQVHGQFIKDGEAILNYGTIKKFETTNSGIIVSGATTATSFHGDGQYLTNIYSAPPQGISTTGYTGLTNLFCGGYLEVDGQSILDDVIVSAAATFQGALSASVGPVSLNNTTLNGNTDIQGISTFSGSIDINASVDIDGYTELDNVNVSGVITATTFSGPVVGNVTGNVSGSAGSASALTGSPSISVTNVSASSSITANNGYYGNVNVNNKNIELGNCTTAGTDNTIKVGTSALEIHHRPTAYATYVQNKADTNLFIAGNDTNGSWGNVFIRPYLSNFSGVACWWGGATELFYGNNNSKKLETTSGGVNILGTLSKSGGSFKIPHPVSGLSTTKHLVHSFLEGPQMDLIYRGKIDLVGGTATVNIDTKAGMTEGTFVLLNRDVQCFTSNETGWTAVKGSVSGNILTITAQDNSCTDTISWMVVGERQDDTVKALDMTDSEGNLIVEPDQPAADTKHADVQAQL